MFPVILAPAAISLLVINETDNITTVCSVTGLPSPVISFTDSDGIVLNDTVDSRIVLSSPVSVDYRREDGEIVQQVNRSITLLNSRGSDTGIYYCVAEVTGVGSVERMVFLLVQGLYYSILYVYEMIIIVL